MASRERPRVSSLATNLGQPRWFNDAARVCEQAGYGFVCVRAGQERGEGVTWHPGDIYKAWEKIHHALLEAMKELPPETLQFLAFRATDLIIRNKAAEVLDWLNNRETLPDWGWFAQAGGERLR